MAKAREKTQEQQPGGTTPAPGKGRERGPAPREERGQQQERRDPSQEVDDEEVILDEDDEGDET